MNLNNLISNIIGTDMKERIKKMLFRYKNRNFKPYIVDRVLYGTDFKFYVANKDGEAWYIDTSAKTLQEQGEWDWKEMEFVKKPVCEPGDVVLECGGHHGLTAVVIAKWIGNEGKLYSFEPNPENLEIIHKNLEINATANVEVIPKAVGSAHGSIMVSNSSSNSYILKGKEKNGIAVDVVMVDDFLHLKPTVLKIDVEGFEVEVLKGAQKLLQNLPKLIIEIHPDMIERYGSTVDELMSLIDKRYKLWVQWEILKAPVPYDRSVPITHRVHLFAL